MSSYRMTFEKIDGEHDGKKVEVRVSPDAESLHDDITGERRTPLIEAIVQLVELIREIEGQEEPFEALVKAAILFELPPEYYMPQVEKPIKAFFQAASDLLDSFEALQESGEEHL